VFLSRRRDDRKRPIAAGHAERIRAPGYGVVDERRQVLTRAQNDHFDASFPRSLGNCRAHRLAPA
jgi:hypothetical protein